MKKILLCHLWCLLVAGCFAQDSYIDSMQRKIKRYVDSHKVVKGEDKKHLHFFDVNPKYRVVARIEKPGTAQWFEMPTSGKIKKVYRVYGVLNFMINDTLVRMNLYQSQGLMGSDQYQNHLFLPFTDATTGVETYETGRYLDLKTTDIKNNEIIVDFNKAYNPYCAYVSDVYNCPIPPKENHLAVAIRAGEKAYSKH